MLYFEECKVSLIVLQENLPLFFLPQTGNLLKKMQIIWASMPAVFIEAERLCLDNQNIAK